MDKIAIGILSFRRPDYLKRCLASLARNREKDKADIFLFQDGPVNAHSGIRYAPDADVERSVRVFQQADLPNKILVRQKDNIGPAAGVSNMLLEMFGRGYGYVVLMANDMEVSAHFIKTHRVVCEQFKDDAAIGVLRTGPTEAPFRGGPVYSHEEAKRFENKLCKGYYMMQDFGCWRKTWEKMEDDIEFYHRQVTSCDWRKVIDYAWLGRTDENHPAYQAIVNRFGTFAEDVIHIAAAKRAGMQGLHTVAPRVTGFGRYSALRDGYEREWPVFGMDNISLWGVGDVDRYEIIECTSLGIPCGLVGSWAQKAGASPSPGRSAPDKVRMVYKGRQTSPFSIRGNKSQTAYLRVYPNEPVDVFLIDVPFFEKQGFRKI